MKNLAGKTLSQRLLQESEGILARLVAGCLDWQRGGMIAPPSVRMATAEYRSNEDRIGAFLTERCKLHGEFRVKSGELYDVYKQWCKASGEDHATKTLFTQTLTARGIKQDEGRRWYIGVALATEDNDEG